MTTIENMGQYVKGEARGGQCTIRTNRHVLHQPTRWSGDALRAHGKVSKYMSTGPAIEAKPGTQIMQ